MSDELTPASPEDPRSPEAYQGVLVAKSDYAVVEEIADVSAQIARLEGLRLYAIKELSTRPSRGAPGGCRHGEDARSSEVDAAAGGEAAPGSAAETAAVGTASGGVTGDGVTAAGSAGPAGDEEPVAVSPEHAARLAERERLVDEAEHEAAGYSVLNTIDLLEAELTAKLRISAFEASKLITMSLALTSRLPATMGALIEGRLDLRRAQLIHEQATPMGDDAYMLALREGKTPDEAERVAREITARLEAHILKRAPGQSPKPLIKAVRRAVLRLDPGYAERHRKDQVRGRKVTYRSSPADGMGDLFAHLPAAEARAMYTTIDAYARLYRSRGDQRTLDELRADILAYLVLNGHLPPTRDAGAGSSSGTGSDSSTGTGTGTGTSNGPGTPGSEPTGTDSGQTTSGTGTPTSTDSSTAPAPSAGTGSGSGSGSGDATGADADTDTYGDDATSDPHTPTIIPGIDPRTGDVRAPHTPTTTAGGATGDLCPCCAHTGTCTTNPDTGTGRDCDSTHPEQSSDQSPAPPGGSTPGEVGTTNEFGTSGPGTPDKPRTTSEPSTPSEPGAASGTGTPGASGAAGGTGVPGESSTTSGSTASAPISRPGGECGSEATPAPGPAPAGRPVMGSELLPGGPRAFPTAPGDLGVRANANVTVSLDTLLRISEEPGELEGHGPISAVLARALSFAEGSTWRRLVTDPLTGQLLDFGRTKYAPPVVLQEFARARDMLCRTVNCDHPASKCDLDHTKRFPEGPTSDWNLHSHCRRHHRLKHEGGWHHEVINGPAYPRGTLKITSPTGHVYYSHPPAIGPITGGLNVESDLKSPDMGTSDGESFQGKSVSGTPDGSKRRSPRPSDPGPPPF